MSVYIKGMEMPTSCYACPCADLEYFDCNLMPGTRIEQYKRLDDCPLVPVPEHGRLGDLDLLTKVLKAKAKNPLNQETAPYSWAFAYECLADAVGDMPTIIPASTADKEGEE